MSKPDAIITEHGHLQMLRAGKYKAQRCPYSPTEKPCGDHCPLLDLEILSEGVGVRNRCVKGWAASYYVAEDRRPQP